MLPDKLRFISPFAAVTLVVGAKSMFKVIQEMIIHIK